VSSTHLGLTTKFVLLSYSCGFVDVGSSLWRDNRSAVYNCCWYSPAQSFFGPSPAGFVTIFYCPRFETPPNWGARSPYLYPPGRGWTSYTRGTAFPFRRLLWLAGLRWKYSNPPPGGLTPSLGIRLTYINAARTTRHRKTCLGSDLQKTPTCTIYFIVWCHHTRVNVPSACCIATAAARTQREHRSYCPWPRVCLNVFA
jgi:hypothetical protein